MTASTHAASITRALSTHERYDYLPIVGRSQVPWPQGKKLAVYIAVGVEDYHFGDGHAENLLDDVPAPDLVNASWRDYGNRVGAFRLLKRLESFDLGDKPLAAAYDMIFLMDFKGDALARQFHRSRRALGLAIATPYFNAGLMTINRAAWRAEKLTERVVKALRDEPERYPFMEQDALNATLKGNFTALSPRFNFMGDFFLLDLERRIEPIVLHFVNAPKPWELDSWRGEARFAEAYRAWFAASPWPDLAQSPAMPQWRRIRPPLTPLRRDFAKRLSAFLAETRFIDGALTV